jgi:hypothetical protein
MENSSSKWLLPEVRILFCRAYAIALPADPCTTLPGSYSAETWLPEVRRLRGEGRSWEEVVRYLNARRPAGTPAWTQERLVRGVRHFIAEGLAEKDLLAPAERPAAPDRLLAVVAGIVRSDPKATLRVIAARLEAIREPTPRGSTHWKPGSVAHVIACAKRLGMIPADQPG